MSLNQILAEILGKKSLATEEKALLLDQIARVLISSFDGLQTCFLKDLHLSGWEKPLGKDVVVLSDETGDGLERLGGLFCDCQYGREQREKIEPELRETTGSMTGHFPDAMRRIWGIIDARHGAPWLVITFAITQAVSFPAARPEKVRSISIARATSLQLQEAHGFSFDTLLHQIGDHIRRCAGLHKESLNSALRAEEGLGLLNEWVAANSLAGTTADDDIPY